MTMEEAIKVLNTYDVNFYEYTAEEIADAIDMAIEALSADTSSDLISRADAIEAVEEEDCFGYIECKAEKIYDRIKALPSAEADWIPCNERLPSEKDGQVLVTKHSEVRIATYSEFSGTWYVGEMCAVGSEDPIAWMPLPKPYRENGEEYELATEQMEHDAMYEPTYNSEDGSM